jgi:hypothetical protein
MACTGTGITGIVETQDWLFENWARTRQIVVPFVFNPRNVAEIVAGVQKVETAKGRLKAVGSQWSYSDVAVDDSTTHVINTEFLDNILSGGTALPPTSVLPYALKGSLSTMAKYFVHVEAGIKIYALNCTLDALGLAMPSLGGNNGQSLAGVISTGTHGSDVNGVPIDVNGAPIADAIAAIHLVGPGGQEWWIEREGDGSITDPDRMAELRQMDVLCRDIRYEQNTSLFRAVLVSLGRMGVIYSCVLHATDAYGLTENRHTAIWTDERAILRNALNPYLGNKFVEIFVNPYPDSAGANACVVTTRNNSASGVPFRPDDPPSSAAGDVAFKGFCRTPHMTQILVALNLSIGPLIALATSAAVAALASLNLIPIFGPILFATASTGAIVAATAVLIRLQNALLQCLATTPGGNFAEQLSNVVNIAVEAGQQAIIPQIVSSLASSLRPLVRSDGTTIHPLTRESYRISTEQFMCPKVPEEASNCERNMDGMEFAFDMSAGKENLFTFITNLLALADSFYAAMTPAAFGFSLRFTGKTEALLGMQQFSRTCSVEIFLLRRVTAHERFIPKIYELANSNGGIPHWGLMHSLTKDQVNKLYPGASEWRQALRYIIDGGKGRTETFQSNFSIERGLEPETYLAPSVLLPDPNGDADPYDFGTLNLHERVTVTFHFKNSGGHTLRILGLNATGQFTTDDEPASSILGTLAKPHNLELAQLVSSAFTNEEIKVKATFIAERPGQHRGVLTIYTNAPNVPAINIPIRARVEAFSVVVLQPLPPAVLDLGAVELEVTKTVQIIVRNDSTVSAFLTDYTFSNPAVGLQIGVDTGGVSAGQMRAYALNYRPSLVGPLSGDVILHFTDGVAPVTRAQDVIVTFTAIGAGVQAELSPAAIDFGPLPIGAESGPVSVSLHNSGTQPLVITGILIGSDFRIVGAQPSIVGPGQTVQVNVVFRPAFSGSRVSSFSVASNSAQPPLPVGLHGIGVAQLLLRAVPGSLAFADTAVGSSRSATMLVRTAGGAPVQIGAVSLVGPSSNEFRLEHTTCGGPLPTQGECEARVVFAPSAAGPKRCALEVTSSAPTLRAGLTGAAIAVLGPVANVSEVDFGKVAVGVSSKEQQIVVTNQAATKATITDLGIGGSAAADLEIVSDRCSGTTLAAGGSCNIGLAMRPGSIGPRIASLTVNSNLQTQPVTVTAEGIGGLVQWSAPLLDFDNMIVGVQSPRQDAYLRNIGNSNLTITLIEIVGDDFIFVDLVPSTLSLPPNAEKIFWVWFKPTTPGQRQGSLRVHTDAPGSPHTLELKGVAFNHA